MLFMMISLPTIPPISDAEATPLVSLLLSILTQQEVCVKQLQKALEIAQTDLATLGTQNSFLVAEIKRLKNLPQKPKLTASKMNSDKGDDSGAGSNSGSGSGGEPKKVVNKNHKKRSKLSELVIHETVKIEIDNLPAGAVLNGYEEVVVQDIIFQPHNIKLLLTRYRLADGSDLVAKRPPGFGSGQFGPQLRALIDMMSYGARVPQNRIHDLLTSIGVDISTGQISNLLTHHRDAFTSEKEAILQEGIKHSPYIHVDDTQSKHQGKNGYCTVVGNHLFSYFESTPSKSRLNFLSIINPGPVHYVIDEHALAYLRKHKLASKYLMALKACRFEDIHDYFDHLELLGLTSEHHLELMTEAALIGSCYENGMALDLKIISDDAGQFRISDFNGLCWVHAERVLKKLVAQHPQHTVDNQAALEAFWDIYADLKSYKQHPHIVAKEQIQNKFDALTSLLTTSIELTKALNTLAKNRKKLLLVLDHPEIPIHNNQAENDIREYVIRRKISGSTRSDHGRISRDTFVSLKKTCLKLGIRFWDFLIDRHTLKNEIPNLSLLVKNRALDYT